MLRCLYYTIVKVTEEIIFYRNNHHGPNKLNDSTKFFNHVYEGKRRE